MATMNASTAPAGAFTLDANRSSPSELIIRRSYTACYPSLESFRNCAPSVTRPHPIEEMEEKENVNKIRQSSNPSYLKQCLTTAHFPHQTGLRFSRNAPIPSCASIAIAFWLITSFVYS